MTSYHCHTVWSDGETSIAEMVAGAEKLGLSELGISDHFVVHPGGIRVDWSMPPERVTEYVQEVQEAAASARNGLQVRLGLEVDYLPASLGETFRRLEGVPVDYLIGSVHFIDGFPVDGHRRYWDALTQDEIDEKWVAYYRRLREMAQSGAFDVVGHFDLPKKFGHLPKTDVTAEALKALDAVAASGMVLEINTSGWSKPIGEMYPAVKILREARRRDIPLVITADAHHPDDLTRGYDRAVQMAREVGYERVVRFRQRHRTEVPLE